MGTKRRINKKNKDKQKFIKKLELTYIFLEGVIILLAVFKLGTLQFNYDELHLNTYGVLKNLVVNLSGIQSHGKIEFPYQNEQDIQVAKESLENAAKDIIKIIGYNEYRCENRNGWFSATPIDPVTRLYPTNLGYKGCEKLKTVYKERDFIENLLKTSANSNVIEIIILFFGIALISIKVKLYRLLHS